MNPIAIHARKPGRLVSANSTTFERIAARDRSDVGPGQRQLATRRREPGPDGRPTTLRAMTVAVDAACSTSLRSVNAILYAHLGDEVVDG